MHHLRPERRADELPLLADVPEQVGDGGPVLRVEVCVDLVEEVEGRGVAALDGEDEGERAERLLPARELLDALLLVVLGVEGDGDADARVVLHARVSPRLVVRLGQRRLALRVALALDDEPASTRRNQAREDAGEFLGHLFEGALDGLVLALVEVLDEVTDGALGVTKLLAPLRQLVALAREVGVLLECFLVDVGVLFERFVDRAKFLDCLGRLVSTKSSEVEGELSDGLPGPKASSRTW